MREVYKWTKECILIPRTCSGIFTLDRNFYIVPFKWTNTGECEEFVEELEALFDKYGLIRAPYPNPEPKI